MGVGAFPDTPGSCGRLRTQAPPVAFASECVGHFLVDVRCGAVRVGCLADEIGEGERDAQFEGALVHGSSQDLLGLPESVADGVLVDAESFRRSAAAAVFREVHAHCGGKAACGLVSRGQTTELTFDEGAGVVEVCCGERAQEMSW